MNPILLFVLGTLSGSVLIGIIYTIFWMVKTHRKVSRHETRLQGLRESAENDFQVLFNKIKTSTDELHNSLDEIRRHYDNEVQELHRNGTSDIKDIAKKVDEVDYHLRELHYRDMEDLESNIHSYIDSRIDKQYDRITVLLSEKVQKN